MARKAQQRRQAVAASLRSQDLDDIKQGEWPSNDSQSSPKSEAAKLKSNSKTLAGGLVGSKKRLMCCKILVG
eukprot:8103616-Pyramimonas_sp.AAC.1